MKHSTRVHQLAKECGVPTKEFMKKIEDMGIEISSHLSTLTDEEVELIKMELSKDEVVEKVEEEKIEEVIEVEENLVKIKENVSLKEFAEKINQDPMEIIKNLFMQGKMLTINSNLTFEIAEELALEYDVLLEKEIEIEEEFGERFNLEEIDKEEELTERAPIVTIMGHVDHGKTSLLDAIRKTQVADGEAGGITQKIGAYQITKNGKKITFIDTPGHEAFTEMRARGSEITDIAVLIVAADDGVMPQTEEAISHAKAADVPIIVAINKIDKPNANPMKVKQELAEFQLIPIEWGGDVEFVEISAKMQTNLDELMETIILTAEIMELKSNENKRAKGVVLEARLDKKIGVVADVLIQEGTLKIGNTFVGGASYGKVRAMTNDKGKRIKTAISSMPVEIMGFSETPETGDVFYVVQNEKRAKKIANEMIVERKLKLQNTMKHITLDDLHDKMEEEKLKELRLILKADSKGSVEALKESLMKLQHKEVRINIIHAASGAISEGDVKLAEASNAIIIGFHVRPSAKALKIAEIEGVEIRNYSVIFHITEDIEKAVIGMLDPIFKEVYQGRAEVKQVFKVTKIGNIAGCIVTDGKILSKSKVRLLRDGIIIYDGELSSLKRFQDDAKRVEMTQECGMMLDKFNDVKLGDEIEAYILEEVARSRDEKI